MDNYVKQNQEIEALKSIYGKEWKTESTTSRIYSISLAEGGREVTLYIYLTAEYPQLSPPTVELSGPALSRAQKATIDATLNAVYLDNIGQTVLYQWIEKVREILQELPSVNETNVKQGNPGKNMRIQETSKSSSSFSIIHGESIVDRRSCFQAHVAKISKPSDVETFLRILKTERKVAAAKHNVVAWRCGTKYDYDDDGEKAAGSKLFKLLELTKADNVVVAVTRWFGGIQLGSDRFRHYSDSARQALVQAKVIRK